jgi:diadenosine tetraphosphatase ApaH/serine/threonine PP2A family protein phosphatase
VGHSHLPFVASVDSEGNVNLRGCPTRLTPLDGVRSIVNVGSVGQPRDGDRRASALLLDDRDDGRIDISLVRAEYDISRAQEKILGAGLPPVLAQRLAAGR